MCTTPPAIGSTDPWVLAQGDVLYPTQRMVSPSGNVTLTVTEDGNVVVRGPRIYAGRDSSAYSPDVVLWDLREAWGIPSDLTPPVWLTLQVGGVFCD